MRIISRLLVVVAVLGIAGCTPAPAPVAESASPSPIVEVTPTPEPPVAQTIVIRGDSFQLWDGEGNVLGDFPYSGDGDAAIAAIEAATGIAATVVDHDPFKCSVAPWTTANWEENGFEVRIWRDGMSDFEVSAGAEKVGAIRVETAAGLIVGDTWAQTLALYPDAYVESWDSGHGLMEIIRFDVVSGSPETAHSERYWGALATSNDGIVTRIAAPVHYYADC